MKAFDSYTPGIYDYLNSYILNKVDINDFESIFNIESILKFSNDNPRNQFVYSILHLLDFFANEKEKIPYVRWLEIRDNIQREFREINRSRKVRDTVDFLSLEAIDFIFGGNASYNTDEEKSTAPLIYALSFFCGFEQRHIMNLKISDINFDDKLIRNIKNLQFIEWIEMDEKIYNYIMKYYNYREQLKVEFEELILINSEPPRKDLNNIYAIMTRVDNNRHIDIKSIDASLLVRSMVYYSLISSSGKSNGPSVFYSY